MSLMFGYGIDNQRHHRESNRNRDEQASTMPATALGGPGRRSGAELRVRLISPNSTARIATTKPSRNARKPVIGGMRAQMGSRHADCDQQNRENRAKYGKPGRDHPDAESRSEFNHGCGLSLSFARNRIRRTFQASELVRAGANRRLNASRLNALRKADFAPCTRSPSATAGTDRRAPAVRIKDQLCRTGQQPGPRSGRLQLLLAGRVRKPVCSFRSSVSRVSRIRSIKTSCKSGAASA